MEVNGKTILIVGGGRYGAKACKYFKNKMAAIILVDNNPDCQARQLLSKKEFLIRDAEDILELVFKVKPDLIVPTISGHTIGNWLKEYFHLTPLPDLLEDVMSKVPQSLITRRDKTNAVLVLSFMANSRICLEDCFPPPERCALTGQPRPASLYKLLNYAIFDVVDCGKIFVTEQITGGIGAISTMEFLQFLKKVEHEQPDTLAVGTACQCHGILSLFKNTKC